MTGRAALPPRAEPDEARAKGEIAAYETTAADMFDAYPSRLAGESEQAA